MFSLSRRSVLIPLFCFSAACSSARLYPQPILERSDRLQATDDALAARDLRSCREEVRDAAPKTVQPRWLPPLGIAPNGVVLGAVDVPHPAWPSRNAYRRELERCLTARGYDIRGWQ